MKIGLIGYFESGAYSDDLIEAVTKKLFTDIRSDLVFDSSVLSRAPTDPSYLNGFDLLVHCGGSLLGKCTHYPVRDIAQWHSKVETPLALFGCGYRYEPDKEPLALESRERLKLLFQKAQVVSVRGEYTVKHLRENGIDTSKVSGLADPVMACDIRLSRTPICVMGNVRNMPEVEVQHASTESVQRLMAQCYDWLIGETGLPLRLVSFRHNLATDNDMIGAQKTTRFMKHRDKTSVVDPKDYREAVEQVRHASFWFGQRLHPTIFAALQGVPFVGVEYQFDKLLDWASTVGISNYIHTGTASLSDFQEAYYRSGIAAIRLAETFPRKADEIRETARKILELI